MAPSTPSFSPWVSAMRATVKSAILIQTVPIAALESWELPTCKLSAICGYLSEACDEHRYTRCAELSARLFSMPYLQNPTVEHLPMMTVQPMIGPIIPVLLQAPNTASSGLRGTSLISGLR